MFPFPVATTPRESAGNADGGTSARADTRARSRSPGENLVELRHDFVSVVGQRLAEPTKFAVGG
jgi:hypothetical protein